MINAIRGVIENNTKVLIVLTSANGNLEYLSDSLHFKPLTKHHDEGIFTMIKTRTNSITLKSADDNYLSLSMHGFNKSLMPNEEYIEISSHKNVTDSNVYVGVEYQLSVSHYCDSSSNEDLVLNVYFLPANINYYTFWNGSKNILVNSWYNSPLDFLLVDNINDNNMITNPTGRCLSMTPGYLTSDDQGCIFLTTSNYDNIFYNYCDEDQTCDDECYGVCSDTNVMCNLKGQYFACDIKQAKMRVSTDKLLVAASSSGVKKSLSWWNILLIIIGVIIFIVIVGSLIWYFRKSKVLPVVPVDDLEF